jgi:hypothetical protein
MDPPQPHPFQWGLVIQATYGMEARMLTVDDYAKIRIAHSDGMSIRAIARTFQHSRRKVREILANPQPTPY